MCDLAVVNLDPVPLFSSISANCKFIAVRSRIFSPDYLKFIKEEIQRLLRENIIESSEAFCLPRLEDIVEKSIEI